MSEPRTLNELLAAGIQAAKAGRREEARQCLLQVIEQDERNEQAWLWLSGVMDDPRDMQVALANALTINPENAQARKGLEILRRRYGNRLQPDEEPPPPGGRAPAPTAVVATGLVDDLPPGATGEALNCYRCGSEVNDVAETCWNCMAWVHCCENCSYRREGECKKLQDIRGQAIMARNECPWWTPAGRPLPAVPPWR